MLPTGEIEGVDPGKEGECDPKCTFLAGFGLFFSEKKRLPAGEIWMFFRGLGDGGQEVTKSQTKHQSKLRLKRFASKSRPLQNTIFIIRYFSRA